MKRILIGLGHVIFSSVYVLLCVMMGKFVDETGGVRSLLWSIPVSLCVFTIIPISMLLVQRYWKIKMGSMVLFPDLLYGWIGLGAFVIYVNHILLRMG